MTMTQKVFCGIILKAVAVIVGVILLHQAVAWGLRFWLEPKDATSIAVIVLLAGYTVWFGIAAAWQRAKWIVEDRAREVFDPLKDRP